MKKQTKSFFICGFVLSMGHFIIMLLALYKSLEGFKESPDFQETFIHKFANLIDSVLMEPGYFLRNSLFHNVSVPIEWLLEFFNSLLWGFTLASIIFLLKNLKTKLAKQ